MTIHSQSPDNPPTDLPPTSRGGRQDTVPAQSRPPNPGVPTLSPEGAKLLVEEWKTVIDVQMHFNEILLRMRTTGVSVVIAVYGAAALSISQFPRKLLLVFGHPFHPSAAILAFGLLLLLSIFWVDRLYYFCMLVASVEKGEQLDAQMQACVFSGFHLFGLTTLISTRVTRRKATNTLYLFYGLPFIVGCVALWYVLFGYEAGGMYF